MDLAVIWSELGGTLSALVIIGEYVFIMALWRRINKKEDDHDADRREFTKTLREVNAQLIELHRERADELRQTTESISQVAAILKTATETFRDLSRGR